VDVTTDGMAEFARSSAAEITTISRRGEVGREESLLAPTIIGSRLDADATPWNEA
jgi:hypothetical protein